MIRHVFVFLEIFEREGGIQSYVKDILQAYLDLGDRYQADIFLLRDGPNCPNPFKNTRLRFHYCKSSSPTRGRLKLSASLGSHLLTQRPQQVFCGHINLAPLIRFFCQPLGIPYTILTYGKEVWEPLSSIQKTAFQQANGIWTISRYSRDQACEANQIDPQRVKMLPCVVDENRFTPGEKSLELLQKYNLKESRVLMTVARLWSGDIYKGVDVTIRALPNILEAFPDVKYLVIGRGDDQPRLAKLAQELGVSDRVVFAGFVPNEALVDHYRLADAYIMPSQEGFGIVYLEAMACGIPVLSGDDDGSADPVQDGRVGWQVPHRDPQAVAQACREILAGIDPRCQGAWLREQTIAYFGKSTLSKTLKDLLED